MGDGLKNWVMVILTLVFVSLYASALIGWLRPLTDVTMITRLEPVIFVIIGYYFGRLPAQANEKTLKDEIDRYTKRTEASQHAKETAEQEREVMEEKIKNAKIALRHIASAKQRDGNIGSAPPAELANFVDTAVSILDS